MTTPLDKDTLVLALLREDVAGTWVRAVTIDVGTSTFKINLNKTVPGDTTVAYFLLG